MRKGICFAGTIGLALAVALATPVAAQTAGSQATGGRTAAEKQADNEKLVELLRKDVRAQKSDIVAKTMKLDAAQAAAFWPVYKAYDDERAAIGTERLQIIQDLAEHFESLNDTNAKGLMDRAFANEEKRLALEKRYKDEFLKVLPAKTVARFFQVDNRINNLINLELSSQIPLVN
jgi:hypothetical protein